MVIVLLICRKSCRNNVFLLFSSFLDVAPRELVRVVSGDALSLVHSAAKLLLTIGMHSILTGLMVSQRLEFFSYNYLNYNGVGTDGRLFSF